MSDEQQQASERDEASKRDEMDEVQERLDADSEGDGLAAEADRGEETGLAEG
ncbi:MAG: hypothetical protein ACXVWW_04460 [Nocardioides sp.]